jgi:hypothetical protein
MEDDQVEETSSAMAESSGLPWQKWQEKSAPTHDLDFLGSRASFRGGIAGN